MWWWVWLSNTVDAMWTSVHVLYSEDTNHTPPYAVKTVRRELKLSLEKLYCCAYVRWVKALRTAHRKSAGQIKVFYNEQIHLCGSYVVDIEQQRRAASTCVDHCSNKTCIELFQYWNKRPPEKLSIFRYESTLCTLSPQQILCRYITFIHIYTHYTGCLTYPLCSSSPCFLAVFYLWCASTNPDYVHDVAWNNVPAHCKDNER